MDLLQFARGPALTVASIIFVLGVVWRLLGIVLLRYRRDFSEPRNKAAWKGLIVMVTRSLPKKEFAHATVFIEILGYTFHLGLFAVVFLYRPHVLLIGNVLKGFLPLGVVEAILRYWPTLPGGVLSFLTSVSIAALLVIVIHRRFHPVKRLISNADDYLSWLMTVTPLATGLAAYMHLVNPYNMLLAAHILSVEALMIWFPFGKLMHMFTIFAVRGASGVLFERKGAAL
jgi:nitrate reductase gamma subunit